MNPAPHPSAVRASLCCRYRFPPVIAGRGEGTEGHLFPSTKPNIAGPRPTRPDAAPASVPAGCPSGGWRDPALYSPFPSAPGGGRTLSPVYRPAR
ncbi:hypothetical protein HMPREF0262_03346 [Clostridium sp. ATCC 29733]|nr:hypothetical protein HMPREF0262_03346 [Clostridium sp. ATCC 29733]